ncbi:putative short chain dehydrogenase [Schistosoma mansoni]|uniref:putative short chain dehydrogenase n=1 Tax=Schistosoma mansoni TaxID=6183 RepID=UPI0001A62B08|nr:putative short chain dehydrogenase [Schistosoma mansoni]|eukprot:XP_018648991.1 putative short chain dehydrogenase [Schistosoma mansoni]
MSAFRNLAWFSKGMREYTKSGYESAASRFDPNELKNVRLDNRRVLVTGANSGIGLVCCKELAKHGAEIHMVCRSKPRAEEARQQIISETGVKDSVSWFYLHPCSLSELRNLDCVVNFFDKYPSRTGFYINNAGCMINEYKTDENGLEANFATNTLGTYILTESLIPALKKSPDARVITVSSGGMLVQKLNHANPMLTTKPNKFDGTMVYAQNKRQQVVMTEMWSQNYPEIFFCSMHPGWADTPAVALSMPSFYNKMKNKLRTPEQGADAAIWLALVPNVRRFQNGSFFQDRQVVNQHLKLACTHSKDDEKRKFMSNLADIAAPFLK